jgi:predicted dienelactone hydrolase
MLKNRMGSVADCKRWLAILRKSAAQAWRGKTPQVVALLLAALGSSAAQAAGIRDIVIPADATHPRIVAELWTPCALPARDMVVDRDGFPTTIRAVRNCAVTRRNLPLILISHGMFEDRFSHHDTAEALADAGFAVVAINHTQDSMDNMGGKTAQDISSFLVRPIDVQRTLSFLLDHPPAGTTFDRHRIGFFGFSRGGYTGLVLAGAQPDFDHVLIECPEVVAMCRQIKEHQIPAQRPAADPRIKAFVIADPLNFFPSPGSLKNVSAPLQLWGSEYGGMGVRPMEISALETNLPVKPEFHRAIGAAHLSFDTPCSQAQVEASDKPVMCTDPKGFDRVAFHSRFNGEVVRFFRRHLAG